MRPRDLGIVPQFAIEGLVKRFGAKTAVDGLSLSLQGGEVVGLLGPNGAGKSTTMLCAAGLVRPDEGRFFWAGKRLGPERGRTIALIPETPEVYAMLTVWEHMTFVAKSCKLNGAWEERAEDLLERFGLAGQRDALGGALSKGMRQKTLIAATILAESPVLLFDEPMIGLDPLGQRELRELLASLKQKGHAIVISTHMLEQAETICDRVAILKNGRCIATGTFDQLQAEGERESAEDVFLELTR